MIDAKAKFNSPRTIAATIILSVSGWMVFMAMPIMVGVFADERGYSDAEVGYLASAELAGVLISSILASLILAKANRQYLAAGGLLLSLIINILSLQVESYAPFMALRTLAGIGSGMCYAIAVANLAGTINNTRNYSYMIFALVSCNAVELYYLPQLTDMFGLGGILYTFAIVNALTLLVVPFIAPKATSEILANNAADAPKMSKEKLVSAWLCLAAIAFFYMCISSYWAYIERWGVNAGFDSDFIATALAVSTVLSLIGCYFAYIVSRKLGQFRPLIITLCLLAVSVAVSASIPTKFIYFLGLIIYQLLWNSIDIYQLGTLANIDKSGKYTALVSGAQGIGQMIGPAGAASMIVLGYGLTGAMYFSAFAAIIATMIYFATRTYLLRHNYVEPLG